MIYDGKMGTPIYLWSAMCVVLKKKGMPAAVGVNIY